MKAASAKLERPLTVACIGLGRMGSGIARNIQAAGFPLTVYNRTREKTEQFVAAGAKLAGSPREAAAADIVVTNLMDDASVLSAVTGENGILAAMRPGAIHLGTTTISPDLSTRLAVLHAAQGSHYLAAPVAGRPDAAAAGKLYTFVAGQPEIIERCRPVLEAYTQMVYVTGEDAGGAMSLKLVMNFMVAGIIDLLGQMYAFAEGRSVDIAFLTTTLKPLLPIFGEYLERISTRNFENPGFTLDAGLKDIRLILDAAGEAHVPLPSASELRDACLAAQARGLSQRDWCCITEIARANAGQI